jgi:GNAT superfamily N-acetyltransferase
MIGKKFLVRVVTSTELKEVERILDSAWECQWTVNRLHQLQINPNVLILAIDDLKEDIILGVMILEYKMSYYRIVSIAVAQEHRNKGVGSRFIQWLEEKLKKNLKSRVEVSVPSSYTELRNFFANRDYVASKLRVISREKEIEEIVMYRDRRP